MNGRYRIIDEGNFSVLGTFDSQEDAVDYVAALLSVNDADFLDELTIANADGVQLTSNSLRVELRNRAKARERVESAGHSNASRGGNAPVIDAVAAKGYE